MKHIRSYLDKNSIVVKLLDKTEETYNFIKNYLHVVDFNSYIDNDNLYQVAAYRGNELIGLRIFRMKDGKIHLNYSAVVESERGKNINKLMFDKINEIALENNVSVITSNVRTSNTSSYNSLIKSGFEVNK